MILDKEEHRTILLELIDRAVFQGSALDIILELKNAIKFAPALVAKPDVPKADAAATVL